MPRRGHGAPLLIALPASESVFIASRSMERLDGDCVILMVAGLKGNGGGALLIGSRLGVGRSIVEFPAGSAPWYVDVEVFVSDRSMAVVDLTCSP